MTEELKYITTKNLNKKESLEFYILIGYSPFDAIKLLSDIDSISNYDILCEGIKILNEGWYPNWDDENKYKYWNYFKMKGGFSCWAATNCVTTTTVPSALCLKNEETAILAKILFLALYEKVYK